MARSTVRRWGNSLAIRIPRQLSAELGIKDKSPVQLDAIQGKLVISPVSTRRKLLSTLLAQITPENVPREDSFGKPRGREVW